MKIRTSFQIETEDDQWHEIKLDELTERGSIVSHNKLLIIDSAYNIEKQLESLITFYFFERHDINKEKAKVFDEQILKSNWCSFESKRKLIIFIVTDLVAFSTKKKQQDYENILRKIMNYRNAFTHGQLTFIGDRVKLTWFETKARTEFLTDDYLTKIEYEFLHCFELTEKLRLKVGETKMAESLDQPLTAGQAFKIPMKMK